jgi:AcrR family transcriptional regulator
MRNDDIPISDPSPHLAPTAARILAAAKRVLERDGFRALTFASIARESGENQALIRYYFGSKAGLVAALVDSVMYLESVELIETLSAAGPGEERWAALMELHEAYAHHHDAYRMFYEVIPHILRDEGLHPHLRDLFEWYRKLDAWALEEVGASEPDARIQPLALLTVAIADGVALQVLADPDLDTGPAFALWRRFVLDYVRGSGTA